MSVSCKLSFPPAPYPMSALAAPHTGFLQTRATSSFFQELPRQPRLIRPLSATRRSHLSTHSRSLAVHVSVVSTSGNNQSNRFCVVLGAPTQMLRFISSPSPCPTGATLLCQVQTPYRGPSHPAEPPDVA
jgi:hypothetical protein